MTKQGAGISASGPMWNEFMVRSLTYFPNNRFINPTPVSTNKVMLDGNYTFRRDDSSPPEIHSILYYVDINNPLGPFPSDPNKNPQFKNWEWAVKNYFGY